MALGIRLEVRQSQQLVMTPQLQQAIKLLQMSNFELNAFVEREVESNPLLALEEPPTLAPAAPDPEPAVDARVTADGDHALAAETFDTGHENLYDTSPADMGASATGPADRNAPRAPGAMRGTGGGGDGDLPGLEDRLTEEVTLRRDLITQIGQATLSPARKLLACLIVEELDDAGFLRTDLDAIAARLSVGRADVEAALATVQSCDPTGVGARDLAECLALQLAERDRLDPAMQLLLDNLDMIADGKAPPLCRICGVDRADLSDMLAELRTLDPQPGAQFMSDTSETLVPDLFLRRAPWGGWQVELNTETLPRVLIDNRYAADLGTDGAAREFISNCHNNANWLVRSLDQRARTILKVATEIVRVQEGFFDRGIAGLRPLTLKMVADAVEMHESTISRVTMNKYVATDRGIFEMKFFFSNSIGADDDLSAEVVRDRIKRMIDCECPKSVLSDDTIVEVLQKDGICIARRTVAKYRKLLSIPSSVDRRRRLAMSDLRGGPPT